MLGDSARTLQVVEPISLDRVPSRRRGSSPSELLTVQRNNESLAVFALRAGSLLGQLALLSEVIRRTRRVYRQRASVATEAMP